MSILQTSNELPCHVDFKMANKVFVLQVGAELQLNSF
jgi:hypothetical protein